MGITGKAPSFQLGIHLGAAGARVLKVFQDEAAGAFAQHHAASGFVEGTGKVANGPAFVRRQRAPGVHGGVDARVERRFGPAGHDERRLARLDPFVGAADGIGRRGAADRVRLAGAVQPEHDGHFRRNRIREGHPHGEWIDALIGVEFGRIVELERFLHAADGGADADADGPAIFLFQLDAGIAGCHHGGGDGELGGAPHTTRLLAMQEIFGVEVPHLRREAGLER